MRARPIDPQTPLKGELDLEASPENYDVDARTLLCKRYPQACVVFVIVLASVSSGGETGVFRGPHVERRAGVASHK